MKGTTKARDRALCRYWDANGVYRGSVRTIGEDSCVSAIVEDGLAESMHGPLTARGIECRTSAVRRVAVESAKRTIKEYRRILGPGSYNPESPFGRKLAAAEATLAKEGL